MDISSGSILAQVSASTKIQTSAGARIRLSDPDYHYVANAIRSFLKNEFAEAQFGFEEIPTRLSTYSGKGVGHYAQGEDGRADWSPDFKKYIFSRTDRLSTFNVGLAAFEKAMALLKKDHPRWHEALMLFDVQSLPISHVAGVLKVHHATIYRYRRASVYYLYPFLLSSEYAHRRKIGVRYVPRSGATLA